MSAITDISSDSSDLSLAIRLQDGSLGAWAEFVELYGPLVEKWSAQAGLSKAAREDVAQEVFLSVHRSIENFDSTRQGATFRGWLCGFATAGDGSDQIASRFSDLVGVLENRGTQ